MSARVSFPRRTAALLVSAVLLAACGPVVDLGADEPLDFVQQPRTSQILAPDGTVLADLHGGQDRREVGLSAVSPSLIAAVIAIEDRRFFIHGGVDVAAIGRAAVRNVEAGEVEQGGSTLTQQLVKTTMTGPARTLDRKLEEALLALRLERSHDKAAILERYLNTVYFGRGAYGVAAAADRYFGVEPDELQLHEAALLAGLIASPSGFDPFDQPDRARLRREQVLDAMVATGELSRAAAREAAGRPLGLAEQSTDVAGSASWVAAEVRRQLQHDPEGRFAGALGDTLEERVEAVFAGGLRITTTVDLAVQRAAERAAEDRFGDDGPDTAIVSLDPATGAVRALVGGHATDAAVGFNVATQGRRSPGSAFKPLVLATALQHGIGLDREFPAGSCAVVEGVPGWDEVGACNYGDAEYGPLTLREATVRSANTVYARLADELGPEVLLASARDFGIRGPLGEVHALALGSESVVPIELAAAYGVFATLGLHAEPFLIEQIVDDAGVVLYEHVPTTRRVLDDQIAWLVTDTLIDVVERGTGIRASIGRPQAGKTGTSQDNADAWFVGYTPELVTAVWVGFTEGSIPLRPPVVDEIVEGGREPAEIWAEVTAEALADQPVLAFPEPDVALVEIEVDATRNCLPNPYTPPEVVESRAFPRGTEPTRRCTEPTGPRAGEVPEVVGLPLQVATRILTDRGFEHEVRSQHSAVFPPGVVTRQRPAPGEALADGDTVVLHGSVTTGVLRAPPDLLGSSLDDAVERLEADGWVVEVVADCPCSQPPGTVHSQRPAGGIDVPEHDVVTITYVPQDEPSERDGSSTGP